MIHKIQLLTNPKEIQKLYEFIRQFPLDYPNYFDWLEKCIRQLELGEKQAFYATVEDEIIGDIIFQHLRGDPTVLEIKNFRVAEHHRQLGIGSALESMLYSLVKSKDFKKIQVDTHSTNFEMIQFLIKRGYVVESQEFLYIPDKPEVILLKKL